MAGSIRGPQRRTGLAEEMVDSSRFNVLIVAADEVFRRFLEITVSRHNQLIMHASAGSWLEAKQQICASLDVMLVDIGLPDGNGADLIHRLKRVSPKSEAIVITAFTDKFHVIDAVRAGATGYLLRDASPADISACIIETLSGGAVIPPVMARYILSAFNPHDKHLTCGHQDNPLTPREQEILGFVARGYSRDEIARMAGISVHTVVAHSRNIYKKLHVNSSKEAVYEAYCSGLIKLKD